jgi:hypothetical protein
MLVICFLLFLKDFAKGKAYTNISFYTKRALSKKNHPSKGMV